MLCLHSFLHIQLHCLVAVLFVLPMQKLNAEGYLSPCAQNIVGTLRGAQLFINGA